MITKDEKFVLKNILMYDYRTYIDKAQYRTTIRKNIPVRLLLPVYISARNKVESINSTEAGCGKGVDKN